MPRGPEKVEGMEKPKRARKRKPDTSQGGPEATNLRFSGGQGVHREVESEGHEEKYRAVIDGVIPRMNRSAKGGARSSLHFRDEGVLIHPSHQGVCGRRLRRPNPASIACSGYLRSMIACVSKRCSIGWNPSSSQYSTMLVSDIGEGGQQRMHCARSGKRFKAGRSGS
jgi:hypothetical protein